MGGVVAQEVLKACTGKFMPIDQWIYFDATECAPGADQTVGTPGEGAESDGRDSSMITVFGEEGFEKLKKLNLFVVGSGALGCEILKNIAMMGLSSGADG